MSDQIKLNKPLEEYTVDEVAAAINIAERMRDLVYGRLSANFCKVLKPDIPNGMVFSTDPAENFRAGYKDGLEAVLKCFPDSANEFSLVQVLTAFYGEYETPRR